MIRVEVDDLSRPDVLRLLAEHLSDMHATSPPDSVHALDPADLRAADVTVWTAWADRALLGITALRRRSPTAGEIKSMRTVATARGRGVGTTLLTHLIEEASRRGYEQLSLETGSQDFFAPARRLYTRHRFVPCAPFDHYHDDPNSVFLTRSL